MTKWFERKLSREDLHQSNYRNRQDPSFFHRISSFSVTANIIFINVLVFIALNVASLFLSTESQQETFFSYIALNPTHIAQGQYLWTLVSHMFSHLSFLHLLLNMFALFSLGTLCERIVGRKRFLWFYLASGIFAGLFSVALSLVWGNTYLGERIFGSPDLYMLGASGAIFAIAGLFVVLLPGIRFSIIFLPFFSLPAYIMVPLILFLTWIITIASNLPIGNAAHFGGFLAGVIYGFYLRSKYARKIKMLQHYFN